MRRFPGRFWTWPLIVCMLFGLIGMTACATETSAEVTTADDGCVILDDGTCEDCTDDECTEEDGCGCCVTSAASLEDLK